jgi:polyphenol oxidase
MLSFSPQTDSMSGSSRPSGPTVPILRWSIFDGLGLDAVVTTRRGGVSRGGFAELNLSLGISDDPPAVVENRRRAAGAIGAGLDDLVFCRQVHGIGATLVTAADRGRGARSAADAFADVDALITAEAGPVLVIMAADCVPLVLFDPVRRVLATVHAGWGGTVRGVSTAIVEHLRAMGSDPADLVVGIGPSIHPDRYQVGDEVATAARAAFAERVGEVLRPDGTGAWTFDLWTANLIQLTSAGVPEHQVQIAGLDTGPGTPFFSHRSEAPCGRFAVLATLIQEDKSVGPQ